MGKVSSKNGFTLVELILAIGFVSILLLAVSVLTIRVSDMYEKGATVRSINQVGREVMDVLRRDFAQANESVDFATTPISSEHDIYSVCLGDVSYIANSSAALQAYEDTTTLGLAERIDAGEPIRLVRVVDKTRAYCGTDRADELKKVNASADELLTNDSMKLAIHAMNVSPVVKGTSQSLYRVTLVVGTNTKGTVDDDNRCRVSNNSPENAEADYNYCSVAELTTIMRTGGSL